MEIQYFDISWFSSVDGPGTRVVLFLLGCSLRCPWCHSPQSRETTPSLFFFEQRCIRCGACVSACPRNVHRISGGRHYIDRTRCQNCGTCIKNCPASKTDKWNTGALGFPGSRVEVDKLYRLLKPQLHLLKNIGGLTISGGEPLLQTPAVAQLLTLAAADGIPTTVETSASVPRHHIQALVKLVDHWLIGLRPLNAKKVSTEKTGNLDLVVENLEFLASLRPDNITIRTPIIPGYTDSKASFARIKGIMEYNNITSIELLPCNPFAAHYYEAMGIPYPLNPVKQLNEEELKSIAAYFTTPGVRTKIVI